MINLQEYLEKQGEDFIKKMLLKQVTISKKIYSSYVSFQKISNDLYIFKKDSTTPISVIDKTITKFYDIAINHLNNCAYEFELPQNYRFYCYYFSNEKDKDKCLMISHIKEFLDNNEINIIDDVEILNHYAEKLNILKSPILFQGFLNDSQKDKITKYLYNNSKKQFTEFVLSIVSPDIKLNDNEIDSIIFKFEGDKKSISAKIVDPVLYAAKKEEKHQEPNDIYAITLIDIISFMLTKNLKEIELLEETPDYRYLELMCILFNDFISLNYIRYENVEFSLPDFLKKDEYKINIDYISNELTIQILNNNPEFIELFKIFLTRFRKKVKKPYSVIKDLILTQLNSIIDEIEICVNHFSINNFTDSSILKFNNIIDYSEINDNELDNDIKNESEDETIFFIDKLDEGAKNNKIILNTMLLLEFNILTNSFLTYIKNEYKNFGRVFYFYFNDPLLFSNSFSLLKEQFDKISEKNEYKKIIKEIYNENINDYYTWFENKIKKIILKDNVREFIVKSEDVDYIKLLINKYKNEEEFKDITVKISTINYDLFVNHKNAIEMIKNDDYIEFSKLTPKEVSSLFFKLKEKIK